MKIEIIDNQLFSELWVDDEKWKEFHRSLYKSHLRKILRSSSKKELSDLLLKVDIKIGRYIAFKLLALRGYMKAELENKLKSRKIDPKAIDEVLNDCERLGFLDDQREGKLFVNRHKQKGWGPLMIALKLKSKAPNLTHLATISSDEQLKMIQHWIDKKTRSQDFDDIKCKQKLYRFLKGKGFDDTLIRQSLFQG